MTYHLFKLIPVQSYIPECVLCLWFLPSFDLNYVLATITTLCQLASALMLLAAGPHRQDVGRKPAGCRSLFPDGLTVWIFTIPGSQLTQEGIQLRSCLCLACLQWKVPIPQSNHKFICMGFCGEAKWVCYRRDHQNSCIVSYCIICTSPHVTVHWKCVCKEKCMVC